MFQQICILLCIVFINIFSSYICYADKPSVVDTIFTTDDIVVASEIVKLPVDGGDATSAIQSAIDRIAGEGGGVVFLPAGKYRLNGHLVIGKNVTLRGDWAPPTTKSWQKGTIIMPSEGKGNADALPAIQLMANSGVRNLSIWYPDQDFRKPIPYPWAVSTSKITSDSNVNDSQTVLNVTLVNAYKGVTIGPDFNFLHVVRNVYGTPLKTGFAVDTCYDIGRTQNVDFRPEWWEQSGFPGSPSTKADRAALRHYLNKEGTALDIGRDEWGYLYDVHIKGYATGIFIRPGVGNMNGVLFRCSVLDCGTALQLNDVSNLGIGVTGCRFSGRDYAVYAPASFAGVMQFNSCIFDSRGSSAILSEGKGKMTFMNCDFRSWGKLALDYRSGVLSVMGSNFAMPKTHIVLGKKVQRAIILSNTFKGSQSIVNHADQIDLQVSNHQFKFAKPDISPMPPTPVRLPATRKLFVVTDYGASSTSDDNTRAFMQALDAAKSAGGGTVYVPAGVYRFNGEITVPSGVELRGCFDVSHHTIGAGSALLPTAGKGNQDGTPFIRLQTGSGLRGLTIWYPDQDPMNIVAYPWAVQGLGPKCWVVNLNCGNAYQGVDFWTYPSDGHVIKYLSGSYFSKGLFISKCKGDGWVDDLHFNPHYSAWVDPVLKPKVLADWTPVMNYVRRNLDGIVFGRCEREHVKTTFLYAARDGMAFKDDDGGSNARVIFHGTDTGQRCVAVEAAGDKGIEWINTQLTPFAPDVKGAMMVGSSFAGKVSFFNTMIWATASAGTIEGNGEVLIQQLNNLSGTLNLNGGKCTVEDVINQVDTDTHIKVDSGTESARLLGNISTDTFRIINKIGNRFYGRANSLSIPPTAITGEPHIDTSWETDTLPGGKLYPLMGEGVGEAICSIIDTDAHSGERSLRIAGNSIDPKHGYAYFKLLDKQIAIYPDTELHYWIKPLTPMSVNSGIDLLFADGTDLRSSGLFAAGGEGVHPANPKGTVGEWREMVIPVGRFLQGKTITVVYFAYDGLPGTGAFETLFDDLSIESKLSDVPWKVDAAPVGGNYVGRVIISLNAPGNIAIRYTLDGTEPGSDSPLYTKPIKLAKTGLWELRYCTQSADGRMGLWKFGQLYDIVDVRK
ncbi:MAG: chitobiase/beta-hexosaminidase C-terminal domain-containing protein [Armatimonadota bacterium]